MIKKLLVLLILSALIPCFGYASLNENENVMIKPIGGNRVYQFTTPEAVYTGNSLQLVYANPESADVTVYNADGVVVSVGTVGEYGEIEINTTGWRAGYYTIYVESESAAYKGTFYVDWQREGS